MEEQALYRAILAAPHDDMPRLIYADWLDENAEAFPTVQARAERARAEFIRVQCKIARLNTTGWEQATPQGLSEPELANRQRRLLFHHGWKWRRAFPLNISSAPFDRGFIRPFHARRLYMDPRFEPALPLQILPDDSPARRYVPEEPLAACPLWDIHLYASGQGDSQGDYGQYGELLAEIGKSPQLERIGWLKLSFFRTSTVEFLRTGNFANVETLVLNCVPFPEVLEAITENESFRCLRYIQFGNDRSVWAPTFPALLRYFALAAKIREANNRNLPYGEMRPALRAILRDTPLVPVAPPPAPAPVIFPSPPPTWTQTPAQEQQGNNAVVALGVFLALFLAIVRISDTGKTSTPSPTVPAFKMPNYEPFKYDPKQFELPKHNPEVEALLKQIREGKTGSKEDPFRDALLKWDRDWNEKMKRQPPAEAPPPRPVERKDE